MGNGILVHTAPEPIQRQDMHQFEPRGNSTIQTLSFELRQPCCVHASINPSSDMVLQILGPAFRSGQRRIVQQVPGFTQTIFSISNMDLSSPCLSDTAYHSLTLSTLQSASGSSTLTSARSSHKTTTVFNGQYGGSFGMARPIHGPTPRMLLSR